jgi:hypothetical protein
MSDKPINLELDSALFCCDWPDEDFKFLDEPGEHDPCYVVMPGGSCLSLNHHAVNGTDQCRARFIIDACNEKLKRLRAGRRWLVFDRGENR